MTTTRTTRLDLRGQDVEERVASVLGTLDHPSAEEGFELVSEGEPGPILAALQRARSGSFEWSPLQEGPDVWRVRVSHRGAEERTVSGALHWDHKRLDRLLEASRAMLNAGSYESAAARFSEFRTGLVRHIRMEEELLFPVFERVTGMGRQGPTTVMRTEHLEILRLLEEMDACLQSGDPNVARFSDLQGALLGVLGEHNEKEEHVVYSLTDRGLAPDECEDLLRRMQAI